MIRLNVHEAKTHLSRYLVLLEKGESILLCRRNTPIAEIRPLTAPSTKPRPFGLGLGTARLSSDFNQELEHDELARFEGRDV